MKSQIRWLLAQIEIWVAEGIIQPAQAEVLRRRYAAAAEEPAKPGVPWAIILFAGFGAVVIGLGVILLFAYNWEKMHRFVKLGLVFGALAAAHGAGLVLRRRENLRGFSDALHLLGTMLFGAGIWLVAQVYHISAHYPNAFFVWAAGALLLAWALPSVPQGLVAAILIPVWACSEAFGFENHQLLAPLFILVGTGWLAWRLRSPVLLLASVVSFTVATLATAFDGTHVFLLLVSTALLLAGLGRLTRDHADFPASGAIFHFTGRVLYYPLLFITTWMDALRHGLLRHSYHSFSLWADGSVVDLAPAVIVPLVAVAVMAAALVRGVQRGEERSFVFLNRLAVPASVFFLYIAGWFALSIGPAADKFEDALCLAMAIGASAAFLFHALGYMRKGCVETSLVHAVAGSILFGTWVLGRYRDLFGSLLSRGIAFIVMGVALFAVAVLYHRNRKRRLDAAAAGASPPATAPAAPVPNASSQREEG
ncbi:MAG: hypothetical protein A3K19_10700 [Lentisphaerae bacterium RIFOXYB12_FULL_65_16]|nr:MAG: hypothetical protein A3K18_29850 [Lentisphaerae bacterium RIFOXYA12_64_32]OGV87920.1 MAG: hypothetical protein A3K19_10700 [Lentisphaerae bacterium RIFOXYB12_FULL_65_16]